MRELWAMVEKYKRDQGLQSRIEGWMNPYQVRQAISSPGQMKVTARKLSKVSI
jgi:hypothetical protein